MDAEHGLLEEIVSPRIGGHEAHAEAIESRRHQSLQLLEDAVLPPRIALHEFAQVIGVRLHAELDLLEQAPLARRTLATSLYVLAVEW